jgi:mono/diheme cytochrome c family protein
MTARPLIAAVALAALLSGAVAYAAESGTRGDAATGKHLYVADGCYQCHGYVGQGGSAGPHLARTALPLEGFVAQLRDPANQMPPYEASVLSNQQAADIYAYLKSLPAPPKVKDIAILHE